MTNSSTPLNEKLNEIMPPHINEEGNFCSIYKGKDCNCGRNDAMKAIQAHIDTSNNEARIDEAEKALNLIESGQEYQELRYEQGLRIDELALSHGDKLEDVVEDFRKAVYDGPLL